MKIYEFTRPNESKLSVKRRRLIAFPASAITSIESQKGSENAFLKVNGIQVHGSYEALLKQLKEANDD